MQLYQLNSQDFDLLKGLDNKEFLLVESQVYGQQNEFLYHIACSSKLAEILDSNILGRKIEDTGRTIGFWQNLGGKGIYKPQSASTLTFSVNLVNILKNCSEAVIRSDAQASTWEAIIRDMPLSEQVKSLLEVATPQEATKEVPASRRKKSKKSSKK